jgi:4-hydroxy-2-oxoheptanedioate aldolase
MSSIGRLNSVIRAWESGKPAFGSFASADRTTAIAFSTTPYDGVVFEMEHNSWDPNGLQDALQYLLDRRLIAKSGSVASPVTPLVRIPANGDERNQWLAKQALDRGAYGIIWPHISTVEQAMNSVAACRYPRPKGSPRYEPAGLRGDGPTTACRYWGLTQQEYYTKADVWPLDPNGEVVVILMIEDTQGIGNLRSILAEVPGVGAILIGEGDLSQELGVPRQYDHPEVRSAMAEIVATCKEFNVPVGHPHVGNDNVERVLEEGYRLLLASPVRSLAPLEKGRKLAGR